MANQTGVLRGVGVTSGKQWDQPFTVVDTAATLGQFVNLGNATIWSVPEDIDFIDFVIPANTATATRVNPQINGDTKSNKTFLTAFLANATTSPSTRFGMPFRVLAGANLAFIAN